VQGVQDEDGVTREMAVELLRQLLQCSAAAPTDPHAVTPEFLLTALRQLSSTEAVELLPWATVASAPAACTAVGRWRPALHLVAVAHVAEGLARRDPRLVAAAAALFDIVLSGG
jgi:hypothetical protein